MISSPTSTVFGVALSAFANVIQPSSHSTAGPLPQVAPSLLLQMEM